MPGVKNPRSQVRQDLKPERGPARAISLAWRWSGVLVISYRSRVYLIASCLFGAPINILKGNFANISMLATLVLNCCKMLLFFSCISHNTHQTSEAPITEIPSDLLSMIHLDVVSLLLKGLF